MEQSLPPLRRKTRFSWGISAFAQKAALRRLHLRFFVWAERACGEWIQPLPEEAMTRKAHNMDRDRTDAAKFADPRSYWTNDGHEFLFGADVGNRRREVYERDGGMCQTRGCGKWVSWEGAQMHHRRGGLVGRCTCMHNLEIQCPKHHALEHVRVKWGEV